MTKIEYISPDFDPNFKRSGAKLNWLRASVLGANDGIVSIAGLVVGVAGATDSRSIILTAGIAGVVAGAAGLGRGGAQNTLARVGELAAAREAEAARRGTVGAVLGVLTGADGADAGGDEAYGDVLVAASRYFPPEIRRPRLGFPRRDRPAPA